MQTLQTHDIAPDFRMKDEKGEKIGLEDLHGCNVVLTFLPEGDGKAQADAFRNVAGQLESRHAELYAVVPKGRWGQRRLAKELDAPFPILADPRHKVAERYGVQDATRDGNGNGRGATSVIIDRDGRVAGIIEDAAPKAHAQHVKAVLDAVDREGSWDAPPLPAWLVKDNPDIAAMENLPFHNGGSHPDERSPERYRPQPEDRTLP